jgi:hypothetical protein
MRALIGCGIVGPPLFVAVFLVEGALRPDYSPIRDYVSALCIGKRGWIQIANFLLFGTLMLAFATGLRGAFSWGPGAFAVPLMFGTFGFALLVAGIFVGDPQSSRGIIHGLAGLVVFLLSLPAACIGMAIRFMDAGLTGWGIYSILSGIVVVALFVAAVRIPARTGLLQRLSIIVGWTWIALLAEQVLHSQT